MKIYKDSSNLYPSMVVHPLLLDYSMLDYASNNPLFWKLYIVLVIEFTIQVTFIEVIDLWKWLLNVLKEYGAQRKSWLNVNVYANPERSVIFTDLVIYFICSINRGFCTYLDYIYVYKDSSKIYVQYIRQW